MNKLEKLSETEAETELETATAGIRHDFFSAIQYQKRKGRKGTVIGMQLGAHFVFRWVFQDAWKHISASIMTANRCDFHTAKSLFNDAEAWAGLETKEAIAIGRCLRYFVDSKMLPLFCMNPHATGTKFYMVIDR